MKLLLTWVSCLVTVLLCRVTTLSYMIYNVLSILFPGFVILLYVRTSHRVLLNVNWL